ncbi:MAG: bifunctional riboflavin kinase/FAD synthetase [Acholeplasmatales bacterium]|nr:bifunctional riboflavin kinase/FAD synthetase [Acholeplasmatales bacterium]
MKSIFIKDQNFTPLPEPVCAAIGNFDGVHLGHQKLIYECKRHGYKSAVLTFYPHPSVFLKKIPNYPLVTPLEKKTDIISRFGVDYLIVVEFTEELSQMPKEEFISKLKLMNIKSIVCGYDFTFGRRAEGNISDLIKEFEFYEVKKFVFDDVRVSSTYIRELISTGNVKEANRLLGRVFSIKGKVKYGNQNGRLIGFPTANIDYKNYFLPHTGVYFVNVLVDGIPYLGMANIGHNPTFNFKDKLELEVHIFNFDEDIYDNQIEVFFLTKLRDEKRYNSKEELINQLNEDKKQCLKLAGDLYLTK